MPRKKKRGVTTLYSETKVKIGVSLTPTGAKLLSTTAKELGLSRSEFVERIARGDFKISMDEEGTTISLANTNTQTEVDDQSDDSPAITAELEKRSAEYDQLQQEYETLQKQVIEQANTIAELEQKLGHFPELQAQLENSVPAKEYHHVQQELQQHKDSITDLKKQLKRIGELESKLANTVSLEDHEALKQQNQETLNQLQSQLGDSQKLQQQLEQQKSTVADLQSQLKQTVTAEVHQKLQQQLEQQKSTVADLQSQLKQTVTAEVHQKLQQQLEQQKSTVADLQSQLKQTVTAEVHQKLQQQLEQQKSTVADWQSQLKQTVAAEVHQKLQQQLEQHKSTVADLQSQLSASVSMDTYQKLEQEAEQHKNLINQLQEQLENRQTEIAEVRQKLTRIAELEAMISQTVPADKYSALQIQSEHQRYMVETMKKQLWDLVSSDHNLEFGELETVDGLVKCCGLVRQKLESQARAISALQQRTQELQSLAMLAESHLNKWSNRIFSKTY
ncbi:MULTISPECIES: CopG family transcriptional regulator [Limnospira]|uniref:CopG-like DNA-binding protein n=1 Tax=Limnospira indica PCC 8005 TaxID=376219 RepID=A0A9P1KH65_9CYAN|nr:CopG family transcriptional regulator [Limnospira indica]CDM96251.1 CopG-like DNA-binding protein [Limnospira indica PCC 8005]